MSGKIKSWRVGSVGEPKYPETFEVVKKATLQATNFEANNNKYYAIELHKTTKSCTFQFRVFTHYGRTDDLEKNPNAGTKESRYFTTEVEANSCFNSIYAEKTSRKKNYQEVALASSRIGSSQSIGQSSGELDQKTIQKIAEKPAVKKPKPSIVHPQIAEIVRYFYSEATHALTTQVAARITANGIETPLGILTIGQIEKGEDILQSILKVLNTGKTPQDELTRLSSLFYSAIPHRLGRTRDDIKSSILLSIPQLDEKQQTLQLMRDMLQVNGSGNVLFSSQVDQEYKALNCQMEFLDPTCSEFKELKAQVEKSQIKSLNVKVQRIFKVQRAGEKEVYDNSVGNERLLYHGSRIQNWVGILSRGILLPKIVTSLGVKRTDAGWLGSGIYFGDTICTSYYYATPGSKRTRYAAIASVSLGKSKQYRKITYGLSEPPTGFDSCHGVRGTEFQDDEYVIYKQNRQKLDYVLELTGS